MQEPNDKINNYKKAYANKLGYGKRPALILVDFVEAYFDKSCELYADVDQSLASALRVREAASAQNVPIVLTNLVYQQGGADGGVFYQKVKPLRHFQKGEPMGAWPRVLTLRIMNWLFLSNIRVRSLVPRWPRP